MKRMDRISKKQINVVLGVTRFAQLDELARGTTKTHVIDKLIADEFERRNRRGDHPAPGHGGPPDADSRRPGDGAGGSGGDHAVLEPDDDPAAIDPIDDIA